MTSKISNISKIILVISALALVVSLFVPIWSIYLDAPQYPEGLSLQIWANAIRGDVDIINGLNHYIGMKTLHSDDFIEFTILPYIIGFYVLLFLLGAIIGNRKLLSIVFILFILFGIGAMIDFYIWEYNYGHNLDPNAAIKVPGMAYQPPLIGFKQLLNFGAYSIPDIGGWLLIGSGALLCFAVIKENKLFRKSKKYTAISILWMSSTLVLTACSGNEPQAIDLNKDACHFCKMAISDGHFGAEVITNKGRVYKFDDLSCMMGYAHSTEESEVFSYYISDYTLDNSLIEAKSAWYIHSTSLKSPMNGNFAAFFTEDLATEYADKNNSKVLTWSEIKEMTGSKEH
ncbi:MAG: nitrous oxide reductase accessory protein NosL [Moheibacter sp.]